MQPEARAAHAAIARGAEASSIVAVLAALAVIQGRTNDNEASRGSGPFRHHFVVGIESREELVRETSVT